MAGEKSKILLVDKMPVLAIELPLHTTRRYWLWWSDLVKTRPTNCIKNNQSKISVPIPSSLLPLELYSDR